MDTSILTRKHHPEVARLVARGMSHGDIAKALGVSRPRVSQIAGALQDAGIASDTKFADLPLLLRQQIKINEVESYCERTPRAKYNTYDTCDLSGDSLSVDSLRDQPVVLPLFPEQGYREPSIVVHPSIAAFLSRYTPTQAQEILDAFIRMRQSS